MKTALQKGLRSRDVRITTLTSPGDPNRLLAYLPGQRLKSPGVNILAYDPTPYDGQILAVQINGNVVALASMEVLEAHLAAQRRADALDRTTPQPATRPASGPGRP